MNAPAMIHSPIDRLTSWFRRGEIEQLLDPDRRATRRLRYEQIGAFLFKHDLEPNSVNYDFAARFLGGSDARLMRVAREMLGDCETVSEIDIERIVERCAEPDKADQLGALARELEGKVSECLAAVGDSAISTTAYSSALDAAADQLSSEPAEAYRRLLEVTLEVAETTRKIGGRLERTRRDTRRLRADLNRATRAAEEDHLTGLPNRRGFFAQLEKAAADQAAGPITLALCDIDNFKAINDGHGHETGDRVLRFVSQLLRKQLDPDVLVGRYGGEEFVCMFRGVTVEAAAEMLDDARIALGQRTLRDQSSGVAIGTVTFSAGVAAVETDTAATLKRADDLLYAAKRQGKDLVLTVEG